MNVTGKNELRMEDGTVKSYSVLMSVYYKEQAEYLRLSMQSMIEQSITPEQFVLVCDGPLSDALNAVIAEFEQKYPEFLTVVRLEENKGLGTALNRGLEHCRNELIARMDSDDIAVKDRMKIQLAAMDEYTDVSVIGGQIAEYFEDPEVITGYRAVPITDDKLLTYIKRRNPMNHVTVVFRKSHVMELGGYPEFHGPGFEDYYLWVNMLAHGFKLKNLNEVCCKVRVNYGQYSRRGGHRYFRNAMCVERLMLEQNMISRLEFIQNAIMWYAGAVIIPTKVRKVLFSKILRKQKLDSAVKEQ